MTPGLAEHWSLWNIPTLTHCMPVVFIIQAWLFSVAQGTGTCTASLIALAVSSFVLHSAHHCISSFTAERHALLILFPQTSARDTVLGVTVLGGKTSPHTAAPGSSATAARWLFPARAPGFLIWAVGLHSLNILVCVSVSQPRSLGKVNLSKILPALFYRPSSSRLERRCWRRYFEWAIHGYEWQEFPLEMCICP